MNNTFTKLIIAVIAGFIAGEVAHNFSGSLNFISAVVVVRHIAGQIILFFVPLIIFAFISSSIAKMGNEASQLLTKALVLAYSSSIGAAFMAMGIGYAIISRLNITTSTNSAQSLPKMLFELNIPPIMSVMSALALAVIVGLGCVWSRSQHLAKLLNDLHHTILTSLQKMLIPTLPIFIGANFCILSYQGELVAQLPTFATLLAIALVAHFVWLLILYGAAGVVTHKNPWLVAKNYGIAYLTAVGTMSSAATLPVAINAAYRSPILNKKRVDFAIPLLSNIHLSGSILTETLFVMAVSQIIYGSMPEPSTMVLFILLLGLFAIGAPGVPGGTVIASLGIVISILGFDASATALLLTIFALQDSFGTACNIVGDGAIALILNKSNSEIQVR